jgi:hypothetical protein
VPRSQKKRAARAAGSASGAVRAPRRPEPATTQAPAPGASQPEPWSRRALLILALLVAALQVPLAVLDLVRDGHRNPYLVYLVVTLSPLSPLGQLQLLLAYVIAMPLARRLGGEFRSMRVLEAMSVGAVVLAVDVLLWQLALQVGNGTVVEKGQVHTATLIAGAIADVVAFVAGSLAYPFLYRRFWMPRRRLRR